MKLTMKTSLVAVCVGLLAAACGGQQEPASETKLIGGTAVNPLTSGGPYPATIGIAGNCTAAKIGPKRFITAAHCVNSYVNSPAPISVTTSVNTTAITPMYQPGGTIVISASKNPVLDLTSWKTLTIKQTHLHPSWGAGCTDRTDCDFDVPSRFGSDVAVFDVNEETPDIATATLDFSHVNPGDHVVITGYGCEDSVNPITNVTRRFKYNVNEARPLDEINQRFGSDLHSPFRLNVATVGQKVSPSGASLCPGDSGGPLYRDDGTERNIVGINAYYDFLETDETGVSAYNWHARIEHIKFWLQSLPEE